MEISNKKLCDKISHVYFSSTDIICLPTAQIIP